MILPINIQIFYFLYTALAGIIIGIMFDVYRILRGFNNPNKFITAISDLLFWILAAIVVFIFFFHTNNGELRYYTFVGIIIGIFLYFKLFSRGILKTLRFIIYYFIKFIRILVILIFYPIKLIGYGLKLMKYEIKKYIVKVFKNKKFIFKKEKEIR
ncbi:spore cortex biosynthesis protein YabQ [Caloramator quimbayensis]|uniref:Spore cortex biosynthesis protein YabQ n=1 Tax=Caloramator quimbayensis TaxID=1147123 RepID=A0A1T4Y0S4_9CLOT|nr:spore cortex biosynthesis protein YabQ [Caloramator quimbayensis]SKA95437.1 spore cortex biosynthesis protein YabQ [Caloramator quimbayensis]